MEQQPTLEEMERSMSVMGDCVAQFYKRLTEAGIASAEAIQLTAHFVAYMMRAQRGSG